MHFDRLRLISTLPLDGGWRADLGVDRSTTPPRAVLVAGVPPAMASSALALSQLARGVDLASRVLHPALRRVLGTGEVDGDLVLVEAWHEGATLRDLLETCGPLSPELGARVVVDVAGALHASHTLAATVGPPLCHGGITAERILLGQDGEVLLCGMGRPFAADATPVSDLRDLVRLLVVSLRPSSGEAAGPLAEVIDQVLVGGGYATAAAFAEAVARAVIPASAAVMATLVAATQPEGAPAWLARRRSLAQALLAEGVAAAQEVASPSAIPPATTTGGGHPAPAPPGGPAHRTTPPPLPVGAAVPTATQAPMAEQDVGPDQFTEVVAAAPRPTGRPDVSLAALMAHPSSPLAVVVSLGLLGVFLGLLLGYALSAR